MKEIKGRVRLAITLDSWDEKENFSKNVTIFYAENGKPQICLDNPEEILEELTTLAELFAEKHQDSPEITEKNPQ